MHQSLFNFANELKKDEHGGEVKEEVEGEQVEADSRDGRSDSSGQRRRRKDRRSEVG